MPFPPTERKDWAGRHEMPMPQQKPGAPAPPKPAPTPAPAAPGQTQDAWIQQLAGDKPELAAWLTQLGQAIGTGNLEQIQAVWLQPPKPQNMQQQGAPTPAPPGNNAAARPPQGGPPGQLG